MGPMYSGKTTTMLGRLERACIAGKRVLLFRHTLDTRGYLGHNGCKAFKGLDTVMDNVLCSLDVSNYDIIGVDEGQFFSDLKKFCINNINSKDIIISCLSASSECEMFAPIIESFPYCQNIIKLEAVCTQCGRDANFTYFCGETDSKTKVLVGGIEKYTALCSDCYFKNKS